jgi:hypothetical protein
MSSAPTTLHRSPSVRYQSIGRPVKTIDRTKREAVLIQSPQSNSHATIVNGEASKHNHRHEKSSSDSKSDMDRKPNKGSGISKNAAVDQQQQTTSLGDKNVLLKVCDSTESQMASVPNNVLPPREELDMQPIPVDISAFAVSPFRQWRPGLEFEASTKVLDDTNEWKGSIQASLQTITTPAWPHQTSCTPSLCSSSHDSGSANTAISKSSSNDKIASPTTHLERLSHMPDLADLTTTMDQTSSYTDEVKSPVLGRPNSVEAQWPHVPELYHGSRNTQHLAEQYRTLLVEEMTALRSSDDVPLPSGVPDDTHAHAEAGDNRQTSIVCLDKHDKSCSKSCGLPENTIPAADEIRCDTSVAQSYISSMGAVKDHQPRHLSKKHATTPAILPSSIASMSAPPPKIKIRPRDKHNEVDQAISPLQLDSIEDPIPKLRAPSQLSTTRHHRPGSRPSSNHPAFRATTTNGNDKSSLGIRGGTTSAHLSTQVSYADFNAALQHPDLTNEQKLAAIEARLLEIDALLARSRLRRTKSGSDREGLAKVDVS